MVVLSLKLWPLFVLRIKYLNKTKKLFLKKHTPHRVTLSHWYWRQRKKSISDLSEIQISCYSASWLFSLNNSSEPTSFFREDENFVTRFDVIIICTFYARPKKHTSILVEFWNFQKWNVSNRSQRFTEALWTHFWKAGNQRKAVAFARQRKRTLFQTYSQTEFSFECKALVKLDFFEIFKIRWKRKAIGFWTCKDFAKGNAQKRTSLWWESSTISEGTFFQKFFFSPESLVRIESPWEWKVFVFQHLDYICSPFSLFSQVFGKLRGKLDFSHTNETFVNQWVLQMESKGSFFVCQLEWRPTQFGLIFQTFNGRSGDLFCLNYIVLKEQMSICSMLSEIEV